MQRTMDGDMAAAVSAEGRAGDDARDQDGALTPLHPNHVKLLRLQALLVALPLVVASVVLETADLAPTGLLLLPVLLLAAFIVVRVPLRRYQARGFAISEDRLRVVRGVLFRSDTVVPFGRVQHIDVNAGPLERLFGLATLTLHTAGSHNASVHLPGLAGSDAAAMREAIRQRIKRDTL